MVSGLIKRNYCLSHFKHCQSCDRCSQRQSIKIFYITITIYTWKDRRQGIATNRSFYKRSFDLIWKLNLCIKTQLFSQCNMIQVLFKLDEFNKLLRIMSLTWQCKVMKLYLLWMLKNRINFQIFSSDRYLIFCRHSLSIQPGCR